MNKQELLIQLDEFLECQRLNEQALQTIKKREGDIKRFIDFLDDKDLNKKTVIEYKQFLLEKGYTESSINSYITSINQFLKFLKLSDYVVKTLRLQSETDLDNVVTLQDYNRLKRWSKKNGDFETLLIIKIFAQTGIRAAELKYFTVESLASKIKVFNKGKSRMIPIRKDLLTEIRKYCRQNNIRSGPIFPGRDRKKTLHKTSVFRRLKKIASKAKINLDRIHPHSLRHFFAIEYLKAGGNVFDLADILGHEDIKTTQIYGRSNSKDRSERMEQMRT